MPAIVEAHVIQSGESAKHPPVSAEVVHGPVARRLGKTNSPLRADFAGPPERAVAVGSFSGRSWNREGRRGCHGSNPISGR